MTRGGQGLGALVAAGLVSFAIAGCGTKDPPGSGDAASVADGEVGTAATNGPRRAARSRNACAPTSGHDLRGARRIVQLLRVSALSEGLDRVLCRRGI